MTPAGFRFHPHEIQRLASGAKDWVWHVSV